MQYDLKKDINDGTKVAVQWHGEETKVLIAGDAGKTIVKKGDVLSVTIKQAKELLSYSHLWTLEGDRPVKHAYDEAMTKLAKKKAKKEVTEQGEEDSGKELDINDLNPDEMEKPALVAALKKLAVTFNDRQGKEKLAILLKEVIAEKSAATVKPEEGEVTEQGIAHYLTEDDLADNQNLAEDGIKVGDLVWIPVKEEEAE